MSEAGPKDRHGVASLTVLGTAWASGFGVAYTAKPSRPAWNPSRCRGQPVRPQVDVMVLLPVERHIEPRRPSLRPGAGAARARLALGAVHVISSPCGEPV